MMERDDESLAEQNAEIRRWAEESGLTLGSRLGQQEDVVERLTPQGPVIELTVSIDEDVYEAAMLRATHDGYDNAPETVEAALREWARGY
jgi:isopentenyl diphosphate isomerase/L-lactate dehydrogenase-like FMN-dependent dehydrogenase